MSADSACAVALLVLGIGCNLGLYLSLRAVLRQPVVTSRRDIRVSSGSEWVSNAPLREGMIRKGGLNDLSKVDRTKRPPPPPMRRAGIERPYSKDLA